MVDMKMDDPTQKAGATRTCIGCRKSDLKSAMMRLVAGHNFEVVVDVHRRLAGRGAYVHADPECIKKACRKSAFSISLKCPELNRISPEWLSGIITGHAELHGSIHENGNLPGIDRTDSKTMNKKPDHRRN